MQETNYITVTEQHELQRLDNFLLRHLKGMPKSHIYRIIRKGEIRVNKKRAKPEQKLQTGDLIRLPPMRLGENKPNQNPLNTPQQNYIMQMILFENDDFIVLNKPSGLAVHGGSGVSQGLIELIRRCGAAYKSTELVHRLDRDTSGCILIAKKMSALRIFHQLFQENKIKKIYTALVKDYWPSKLKYIDAPLTKNILQSGERMVKIDPNGMSAATGFRVLKRYANTSLLQAELHSGRTHQIRVHALSAGHPIVGDEKYGDKKFNQLMSNKGIKRLCLHASELHFNWPITNENFDFFADVPSSFFLDNDS